jgi:hypothetical protein
MDATAVRASTRAMMLRRTALRRRDEHRKRRGGGAGAREAIGTRRRARRRAVRSAAAGNLSICRLAVAVARQRQLNTVCGSGPGGQNDSGYFI